MLVPFLPWTSPCRLVPTTDAWGRSDSRVGSFPDCAASGWCRSSCCGADTASGTRTPSHLARSSRSAPPASSRSARPARFGCRRRSRSRRGRSSEPRPAHAYLPARTSESSSSPSACSCSSWRRSWWSGAEHARAPRAAGRFRSGRRRARRAARGRRRHSARTISRPGRGDDAARCGGHFPARDPHHRCRGLRGAETPARRRPADSARRRPRRRRRRGCRRPARLRRGPSHRRRPRGSMSATRSADSASTVERLALAIQSQVLSGEVPVGTRLRQEALAEEFGVSRTPVREALRQLQATGLLELLPNRGAVVRGPSAREIREAYEVRAELEGLAAELAAERISDSDLLRLREAQSLFRESITTLVARRARRPAPWKDESVWVRANDLFHQAILDASGNGRLGETIADLHRRFPRDLTWIALSQSSRLLEENVEQHEAVLLAIERRDPVEARRAMVDHVRSAGELVTLHFEQAASKAEPAS